MHFLLKDEPRTETLTRVEAMEPDLRAVTWLVFLDRNWGRDGLHTFFFLSGGDFAPQVLESLKHARLEREAAIFEHAMALFGSRFPVDETARQAFFAWSRPGRRSDSGGTIPNELNAFDHALMDDAHAFGSQEQLAERVGAYVESIPSLAAWANQAREKLTEEQRLNWLLSQLTVERDIRSETATWPRRYRQLLLIDMFNEELLNGGLHQFFFNSSGDYAPEVVAALRDFGLARHADAVQRSIDMFGQPYPLDRQMRFTHFKEWSDWDVKLNAPTEEIRDGEIEDTMLAIVKREGLLPR